MDLFVRKEIRHILVIPIEGQINCAIGASRDNNVTIVGTSFLLG